MDPLEQFDIIHLAMNSHCMVRLSELYFALYINIVFTCYLVTAFSSFTSFNTQNLSIIMHRLVLKDKFLFYIGIFTSFVNRLVCDLTTVGQPICLFSFSVTFLNNLFFNCCGMFPTSITITTQLLITVFLALANISEIVIQGIIYNGVNFLCLFIPSGIPLFLLPLLVFVDTLSIISRLFSLAIRLFANLLSGHLLIKIISSFFLIAISTIPGTGFSFIFILVVILILVLEIAVCFLQAYVWLVLTTIYFDNMVINLH